MGPNPGFTKEFIEEKRESIYKLAKLGCTSTEIADVVGIGQKSLYEHWKDDLDKGRGELKCSLRKAQIESAIRDRNTQMLVWLGKQYLGQCEPKQQVEHSGGVNVVRVEFGSDDGTNSGS